MGGMGVLIARRRLGWLDPHSAAKRLAEITRQKWHETDTKDWHEAKNAVGIPACWLEVGELTVLWRSRSCNSVAEDTTHHADSFARALAYADCISAASAVASPLAQTPGILLRISTCVV